MKRPGFGADSHVFEEKEEVGENFLTFTVDVRISVTN